MKNRAVKQYYRILRGLFKSINFCEGKFLKSYREMLNEYAILNPQCTYNDLVLRFGTPQEVFTDYINEQDPGEVIKMIKKNNGKKILLVSLIMILVVGIISLSVRCYFLYRLYQEVSNSIVVTEEIIIQ